jgi:putative ABC transport system permease protein
MKLRDSFRLSLNSILHRRLRSWLTLLGIVIGVAAVVSIVSIGDGAQANVQSRLSQFGADVVTISAGFNRAGGFGGFARTGGGGSTVIAIGGGESRTVSTRNSNAATTTPELTIRDVSIVQSDPNVLAVNQTVSGRAEVVFGSEKTSSSVTGVNPTAWPKTNSLKLAMGRLLNSSDAGNIVIGDQLANSTFKQPITLGRTLTVDGKAFTVVGILAPSGNGFGGGGDSGLFMPYASAWDVTDINRDTFSSLQVQVKDAATVDDAVASLTTRLQLSRKVTARTQDFSITSAKALQEQITSVTSSLTLFLGAIAMVSLLVGAIGVANSMFTSVLEKTREVGIMKALGATNNEVLRLFLIESALFGFVGGVIGAALGLVVSFLMGELGTRIAGLAGLSSPLVTPQLLVLAIVLSTVIGVVSGVWPARAASKLRPIEALRYE